MLRIGMIGYGTIGKGVSEMIARGLAGNVQLVSVLRRNLTSSEDHVLFTDDPEHFFAQDLDIVIEAAGHQAVKDYSERTLLSGKDLMIIAVGALSDNELYDRILHTATTTKRKIIIPSSAIAGLDRIAAASLAEMDEVKLITRKPPKAWIGTIAERQVDLEKVTEPVRIFQGTAKESARLFPESVNVSAALSLAGVGFEKTLVEVYVDPNITQNVHEVRASGFFGSVAIQVSNTPSADNPKTGYIVALSIAKTLQNLSTPLMIGL